MTTTARAPADRLLAGLVLAAVAAAAGLLALAAGDGTGTPAASTSSATPAAVAAIGPAPRAAVEPSRAAVAVSPLATPRTELRLLRLERSGAGVPFAVLSVDGTRARPHAAGDALGPGLRLASIDADAAWIERAGPVVLRERLPLPAGVAPLAARPVHVDVPPSPLPAGLPVSPVVAAMLEAPPAPPVVAADPSRANPARAGIDRLVAAEARRLAEPPAP